MRSFTTICIAASCLASSTSAFSIKKRDENVALKVLQHEIVRKHIANPVQNDRLRRRSTTINAALDNYETLYFINATIGTPAQSLRLHIDTGSSDLWVNTPSSSICKYKNQGYCDFAGTYTANSSSTYKYVNSNFRISYADNSGAQGDYVTDTVRIAGAELDNQEFGIGYKSNSQEGIMGIGYMTNEAIIQTAGASTYANVPAKMVQQGLINTNAYSLWLNDLDANTGSILFGGVNSDKYHGSLSSLPIIQTEGVYSAFYIALTSVGMDGTTDSFGSNLDTAVLLDSGSSLIYLPDNVTSAIYTKLGVTYDSNEGAAVIDCSRANDNTTIDFTFSSPTISVPMNELVLPISETNGVETCILGIAPADGSSCVLGDTFLRSAYVVYDLQSNKIALAQTNFNSTTDNIQEITNSTSTSSGIPDATGVANAVTSVSTAVASSGARLGTVSSTAAAPTTPPSRILHGLGAAGAIAAGAFLAL